MSATKTITQPTDEPVSVQEVMDHMNIAEDMDSDVFRSLIKAARVDIENRIGRALINRTVQSVMDRFIRRSFPLPEGWSEGPDMEYCQPWIELPVYPLVSVSEVRWFAPDGTEDVFASDNYYLDTFREPGRLILREGRSWPDNLRLTNGLQITYVAGYGDNGTDVDEALRLAIKTHVAHAYENRGSEAQSAEPPLIHRLIFPYKRIRV